MCCVNYIIELNPHSRPSTIIFQEYFNFSLCRSLLLSPQLQTKFHGNIPFYRKSDISTTSTLTRIVHNSPFSFRLHRGSGLIGFHFIHFLFHNFFRFFRFFSLHSDSICHLVSHNDESGKGKHNWIETFYFGIYDKYMVGMHHSFIKHAAASLSSSSYCFVRFRPIYFVSGKTANERRHDNLVYEVIFGCMHADVLADVVYILNIASEKV